MKFLATGNEMQEIDRNSIDQIGIPGIVLMERAAMAVAGEIENRFPIDQRSGQCVETMADIKVLIIVEKGNNGGDGLAVAHRADPESNGELCYSAEYFRAARYKAS